MSIIRFLNPAGETVYGQPQDAFSARWIPTDPTTGLPEVRAEPGESVAVQRLLAPIRPTVIFGIGLNYRQHAMETGSAIPERPVVFMKNPGAACGPGDTIQLPACSHQPEVDYECELAVVIGRAARDVSVADAFDYVLGYTASNDVSARWWQKKGCAGQFVRGKSFDTFCPLGPVLLTTDEIPDPQSLRITTRLNGQTMQDGSTADMIFGVAELIAFLSQDTTLQPGTVILTGTPEGVGAARNPPVFLKSGDEIAIEIESIGTLTNLVQ